MAIVHVDFYSPYNRMPLYLIVISRSRKLGFPRRDTLTTGLCVHVMSADCVDFDLWLVVYNIGVYAGSP